MKKGSEFLNKDLCISKNNNVRKLVFRFSFKNKEIRLLSFFKNPIKGAKMRVKLGENFFIRILIKKLLMLKM